MFQVFKLLKLAKFTTIKCVAMNAATAVKGFGICLILNDTSSSIVTRNPLNATCVIKRSRKNSFWKGTIYYAILDRKKVDVDLWSDSLKFHFRNSCVNGLKWTTWPDLGSDPPPVKSQVAIARLPKKPSYSPLPPSLPPSLEKQLDTLEAVELWIQVNMAIS